MTTTEQASPTAAAGRAGLRPADSTAPPNAPAVISLPRHLLSAGDLNRATAEHVLSTAERLEQAIGRQAALRRCHHLLRQGVIGLQG